jgi:hypothetical protein
VPPLVWASLVVDPIVALFLNEFIDGYTKFDGTLGTIIERIPPGEIVFDELEHIAVIFVC